MRELEVGLLVYVVFKHVVCGCRRGELFVDLMGR